MEINLISSLQNSLVKEIILLQEKSKQRKKTNSFICEGLNEIRLAKLGGYSIEKILYCPALISESVIFEKTGITKKDCVFISVSMPVFAKIAYRKDVANALAVVKAKTLDWSILDKLSNPLFLVVERVEKPGNLGAILRNADAAGIDALFLADPNCDLYNPNVIRSSVGTVFTLPVFVGESTEIQTFFSNKSIQVFTTFLESSTSFWEADFKQASAIVLGTEHEGLTTNWKQPNYKNINIPMFGKVDSMNVSAAAAVIIFEATRQRN
jgi:TrmH family RNA methyltransferase